MLELLVVLGIAIILLAILIPFIAKEREHSNRARCADNLRQIWLALDSYQTIYNDYPVVPKDSVHPNGYRYYTGIDGLDGAGIANNDVTASLWLLVREGCAAQDPGPTHRDQPPHLAMFICPSAADVPDRLSDASGRSTDPRHRGNFRGPGHLSYSYCSPFTNTDRFRFSGDTLAWNFPIVADKNPGVNKASDVTAVTYNSTPMQMARANSQDHDRAGQNVLYANGEVKFQTTPFCGVDGDNIYTVVSPATLPSAAVVDMHASGVCTPLVGPANQKDSYLVPTEDDK